MNARNRFGDTALMIAALNGHLDFVEEAARARRRRQPDGLDRAHLRGDRRPRRDRSLPARRGRRHRCGVAERHDGADDGGARRPAVDRRSPDCARRGRQSSQRQNDASALDWAKRSNEPRLDRAPAARRREGLRERIDGRAGRQRRRLAQRDVPRARGPFRGAAAFETAPPTLRRSIVGIRSGSTPIIRRAPLKRFCQKRRVDRRDLDFASAPRRVDETVVAEVDADMREREVGAC